jgi:hypothetical protein
MSLISLAFWNGKTKTSDFRYVVCCLVDFYNFHKFLFSSFTFSIKRDMALLV